MSTLEVNTIKPISGSSTVTLGESGDTIALASGASQTLATMKPVFYGTKNGNQNITRATWTKVTTFTTNEIDTNTAFDGTTFTVPSGEGGKYLLFYKQYCDYPTNAGGDGEYSIAGIYVNGSQLNDGRAMSQFTSGVYSQDTIVAQMFANLSAGDTVEAYAYLKDANGGSATVGESFSCFGGYKILGA